MNFVNPLLLAGATLAAIPVILHLIMRQQPRKLQFPALRFIQLRRDTNRRRLRLRHLLLLAMRMAAVCLLAAALARPSFKSSGVIGNQEAPVAAVLVFDTSPRMDYRHENKTRLEAAREIALKLLVQLPAQSRVAMLDSAGGEGVFQIDLGAARQRIARLETTTVPQPTDEVLLAAAELLKEGPPDSPELDRRELYVFSDLARTAWVGEADAPWQNRLAELDGLGAYVVDVGVEEPRNVTLGELRPSSEILARGRPWTIAADVSGTNSKGARTLDVYMLGENGKTEHRAQTSVELADGPPQAVEFALGGLEMGTHQGYVRLVGSDGLKVDDRRYFTVEVKSPWRVLLAAAPPAEEQAFFISEALAPDEFRKSGKARFDCRVVKLADFADQALEDYAVVALLDPAPLADEVWQLLAGYVKSGGGLAIFLGPAAKAEGMNRASAQQLLAGPLELVPARHPEGDVYLSTDGDPHPLLALFKPLRGTIPWDEFPVFHYWRIPKPAPGVVTVMRYNNDRAALLERSLGKGRALTLTTPLSEGPETSEDNRWNRIATGLEAWPFLMLMDQSFAYLAGGADGRLNYQAGEVAVLRLEPGQRPDTCLLSTPRGDTFRQSVDVDQRAVVVTASEQIGNYRVQAGGDRKGIDRGFSVNLPVSASDLTRISADDLAKVFGKVEHRLARNNDELVRVIGTGRVGRELFPLLIGLVAIVLGVEHVLANRFYKE